MTANYRQLVLLAVYAIAMAQVEASVVVHLRTIYYPNNPLAIFPLNLLSHRDLVIELIREVATVVMILSVALLGGRSRRQVFAEFVYVFGLWDIFYYIWLKLMIGWPQTWTQWDVLFLIPWPWLGPWLAPVMIALLFVIWGTWVIVTGARIHYSRTYVVLFVTGTSLSLLAFLLPAAPLLLRGEEAFLHFQPHGFMWWLFIPGLLFMAWSLVQFASDTDRE